MEICAFERRNGCFRASGNAGRIELRELTELVEEAMLRGREASKS
jgi:hypothetical protein